MYENLKGKKLLVIGSAKIDSYIVSAAKDMGIYVIVVDGIPKSEETFAKNMADESWDIDYRNTEEIGAKCLAAGVDGVIAGYSESRVLAACKIANYIGAPFYATEEQIELTRNKRRFKDECSKYGVRVPQDFCFNEPPTPAQMQAITYPVIVKPTDYAGRKGISICYNDEELEKAISYALKLSNSKTIIVEEYVVGTEFAALYTLSNGEISLSYVNEKYINEQQVRKTGLCDLSITPTKYLQGYIEKTDKCVKDFLKGIGAKNGVAFFQGIVNEKGYWIFEMGYRLNGGNDYFVVEKRNNISYMKMLISHSLTGSMGDDIKKDNPAFDVYHASLELYGRGGKIAAVSYEGEPNYPGIDDVKAYVIPGMEIVEDGSTGQKVFTIKLSGSSREEIGELIQYVQKHIVCDDSEGNSLLLGSFDVNRLNK